jgi:serpin B
MRATHALLFAGLLVAASPGCGGNKVAAPNALEIRRLDVHLQPVANTLVQAGNRFTVDLYSRLRTQPGNLFCSPQNISTAFAMTFAGAGGETRAEMARVFHFPEAQDSMHAAYGALLASLDRGAALGGYELSLANRLWGQQGFGFLAPYLDITRRHYGAELQRLDFQADPSAARATINAWVEQRTRGRITDLMPPSSVTSDTRLVLTSAIYFKGQWATRFDSRLTAPAPFHVAPGVERSVPTMSGELDCQVCQVPGATLLGLPYRGGDLSMVILLPSDPDGLARLEAGLDADSLVAWIGRMAPAKQFVTLPRFTVSTSLSLVETLAAMGMPSAFQPASADFSGIDGGRDLFIAAAVHKAWVNVNEEGTEAAAATGISVGVTSAPNFLRVDHPFLFAIYDHVTGSLLFVGRVSDPAT